MSILVIGYGNPGRLDDGLGPACAERIRSVDFPDVTVESNYQLNIEDAEILSHFDVVVFADASVDCAEPFEFKSLKSNEPMVGFSSHSITAESLLGLSEKLFGAEPEAYAMAVRGYVFHDFGEELSDQARLNLDAAVDHLVDWIKG